MRFIYLSIKFFPYWAIPMILILGEMAYIFRRRGNHAVKWRMLGAAGFFAILVALFFIFRWDMTLFPFIRNLVQPV